VQDADEPVGQWRKAAHRRRGCSWITRHNDTRLGVANRQTWTIIALQPGTTVEVTLTDRIVAVFTVDKVVAYPKAAFPSTAAAEPPTPPPAATKATSSPIPP